MTAAVERGDKKWEEHTFDTNKRGKPCFYEYGLDLFKARMSYEQIEARLNVKYVHGRHPDRRKRQIKSIMKSSRKLERRESRRA
jgi:hypothetical protein